jgi:gliding motility-associated-like protein
MIPISVPCVNFSGCNCWDGSTVSIGNSCPAEPGDINATMNINVVGMNQTTVGNGFITSVCLNDFSITPGVGCTSTSLADIEVVLICPSGTEVTLVSLGSMTGNNVSNMCFELGAGAYTASASPYSGTFAPASSWAALNGCNSNGVWSVEIRGANYETCLPLGSIEGWSISFDDPQITNPVNYVWSPTTDMTNTTSQTPNVCPTSDITYTLTSTDLNGCTTESADVTVTVGSCCVLDIDNVAVVQPTCGLNNGSITITATGSITGLVYSIDGGATTQTSNVFTGLADGTYDIYIIDDAACPVTGSETLNPSSAPVIDNVAPTDPGCGATDGEIEITASGGVAPLTYSIDNGGTFQAGNTFTGLADGTYDIVVEDDLGCQVTGTATLNPSGNLTINSIAIVDAACGVSDGTITIDAMGANASYTYSNDNGTSSQASNVFTGLAGGSYDLVIDDGNGCVVDSTVSVNNPNAPTIDNVVIVDASCGASDGEITITATGGTAPLTYSIDNGTTQVAGNNFTGLGPATYDIVVEDANTCVATTQAIVVQANAPIIDNIALTDPSCGASDGEIVITASGGTAPLSYSIDNGTTQVAGNSFTGLAGATYEVIVEDATGCQVTSSEVLNPSGSISLTSIVLQNASCGASDGEIEINIAGATAAYTYSNDNGATSQASNTFTGLAGGSYPLLIDDGAGCTLDSIVSISNPSAPSIDNVALTDPVCGAADGEIVITATGGTAPLTYSIDNGTTQVAGNSFTGLTGATYDIVVEDATGCAVSTMGTLATTTMPAITSITITDETCAGGDGTITIVATDAVNYSIDNGVNTQLNGDFTSLTSGNYTIVVNDGTGCFVDSIEVIGGGVGPVLDSVITTDLTCFNAADGEIEIYALGTGLTYSIDNGVTFQASNQFSNLPQGSYDVVVENVNGCPITMNVLLTEPAELTLGTNTVDASCFGACDGSIIALANGGTVSGAYDYNWSGGIAGTSDAQAQNVCAGNYTLVVTDDNGCSISENLTITEPVEIVINSAVATPEICPDDCNGTIVITGTNIVNYSIDGGATFQALGDFTNLCPDDYTIVVEDANGCQISQVESVDPAPGIDAEFTVSPESATQLAAQFETVNLSNNATSYEWYTDLGQTSTEENPVFDFDATTPAGDYTICLVASNLARCVDTTCNEITITQDNFYYIPNSFTPNVDGDNDFFYVKGIGLENAEFELIIFDRWGELIYSFDSYADSWDGTYRGSHVPQGTYIWKLTLKWEGELKPIDDIGHVNVLR